MGLKCLEFIYLYFSLSLSLQKEKKIIKKIKNNENKWIMLAPAMRHATWVAVEPYFTFS